MFSDGNGTSNQPYVIGKDIIYKEDAVYGDTDGNGVITVNDAVELLENVLDKNNKIGIEGSAIDYKEYIDLNKDGNITAEDVSMILQRVLNENK